jgi:DNA helicase II / ATP-dependent DNA helicase PcrA
MEFPVVFVIGLIEGLMPSKKGNLEEERRICFVAISGPCSCCFCHTH